MKATTTDFLKRFFEEKEISNNTWTIKDKTGMCHIISSDVVIEHIFIAPISEQITIANILRKIDFSNGSVSHFLKALANCLIEQKAA